MSLLDIIKNLFNNNKINTHVYCEDLHKIKGETTPLSVVLTDKNGNLLANKPVDIEINNIKYTRITDENGIARLNINLNIGSYPVGVSYAGDDEYNKSTGYCRVFVSPKLTVHDLNMKYCDGSKFTAKLTDIEDNPLQGINVLFKVNGVPYTRATNNEGIASLNINLNPGDYNILTYAGVSANNIIHIDKGATRMEGTDINKTFSEKVAYQCAVYDVNNNRVPGVVNITVNGKTYTKTADNEGLYKLNINLPVGIYPIKAEFIGNEVFKPSKIENTIIIKQPVQPTNKKTIVLGCDANTSNDANVQNRIAERLEAEGYPVEKLSIGPNYFASYDYSSNARGKIGIYLIASGIFSIADAAYGSGQFDNYVFGIRGDFGDKGATCFDCPIRADADCTSICEKLNGKTFNQMNNMLQPYVAICGGASTDELANNIIDWLSTIDKKDDPSPKPEPELWDYFTEPGGGYLGQKTGYTCGPHSLMQCIHRLTGEDVSEMELAGVCGTTSDGTDHDGLATGLAWFNREYGYNLKMEWKNFSEVGFEGTQELIDNGACFHHIYYRLYAGHYEVPKWTGGDPIYVLNSLGDNCGDGYCGYIEERSRSTHQAYINGISQKSVCIITR